MTKMAAALVKSPVSWVIFHPTTEMQFGIMNRGTCYIEDDICMHICKEKNAIHEQR